MISWFFNVFFYKPLYNGLIFLLYILPSWADVGIAIVLFTCLVKLALFPLSQKSIKTQIKMKEVEPEMAAIKEKFKDNKEEQARQMMEIYKNKKINPFSGILVLFLQIPIILALYFIFFQGGLPIIDSGMLYNFIPKPEFVNMNFLGILDVSKKSAILAFLAGITQYMQARLMPSPQKKPGVESTFQDDLARSMNLQMKYVFPVIIFMIAWNISGAVALYWATSNLFMVGQELYVRRKFKKDQNNSQPAVI
ncbi:MAG: YidC/Oxa1 family membrane protein insertase [Candidatus Paceibacterota bacterium]